MARAGGYHLFETAFGLCGIAWSEAGISRFQLPEGDRRATEQRLLRSAPGLRRLEPDADVTAWVRTLRAFFEGQETDLRDMPVDLAGVPEFHRRLYEAMRGIGWGQTTTYGALARDAGSPGASRAVGQAMGRNPVPVIIPCHRVLASGGKIGGFSAYGGALTKERLLALEGASHARAAPLLALMGGR